ncbi:MAG: 50S ribosomal protein L11 [Parcubacteria group bacterium GW2011_GWB1_46_8]|nr:MAG: 50S ribosomal protein L11 [Parcubacteria group bacterium GW2011_GWF1_45_5]KKU10437.1 MAG: 50S ribosomal protein L11 [Parcubacteria group bacterium GW2011_GWA1_45_7]KKU43439.1 MAG: 50S ribosomal protein L11 [Parcubacteria group bacterium GW2011_GWA2_46_7]KKU46486.1 MAG: 50S ribosomal protein L11 [Parcubacteria group bacterium GW2011_GWB1_46_8]KKU47043.1 MAG: 50S ribosomal protein L11 [Parcubacteria group bacterium GW2011_GWF2_46_8]
MAKELKTKIKLQIPAGKATPTPPVGPALGQHGVNIGQFITQFNEATKDRLGMIIPVEISVYTDRSFEFVLKTPPASDLLRKAAGILKGSGVPNKNKVGKLTKVQLEEVAKAKLGDLNTDNLESAKRIIAGTAKNMGIEVEE